MGLSSVVANTMIVDKTTNTGDLPLLFHND
jgi:hypothetical protein